MKYGIPYEIKSQRIHPPTAEEIDSTFKLNDDLDKMPRRADLNKNWRRKNKADNIENLDTDFTFDKLYGGSKKYINTKYGKRKIRYYKNGKPYIIVNKKKIKIKIK